MNYQKTFGLVNRDLSMLAPFVRDRALAALKDCHDAGYDLSIFEGYRSPFRQEELYAQGRTKPGKIVTWARAWQSYHQFSLAIDIAYLHGPGKWSWDGDFEKPSQFFLARGFTWLEKKEQVHYEITGGLSWQECYKIAQEHGVQSLWLLIASRLG